MTELSLNLPGAVRLPKDAPDGSVIEMVRSLMLLALAAGTVAAGLAAPPSLMPLPAKMEVQSGALAVNAAFSVAAAGRADARLNAVLDRFAARIQRQTGVFMLGARPVTADGAKLRVECDTPGAAYPALGEDESYTLDISAEGARLHAPVPAGVLHGLGTFAQLIAAGANGFEVPAVHIEDRPRFPWRGLMLDVSRHWMPVEVVKRNLDAMAAVKMNVFHWHLSDDQGFRVESRLYPRLQEFGSDGHFYTQQQLRDVVEYARDRGIRVVPEFDIPGHTTSWLPGYPELGSAPGPYSIERGYGILDPVLDPSREETYAFLDGFIGEMAAIFPDLYFHIGGDEVNPKQWNQSAAIQAFAKQHGLADAPAIQTWFNQRILKILAQHGKRMVGWDEILTPDLPKDAVIQSWRGQASLAEAASKGYSAILSWGYYLDHLRPASYHYAVDPLANDTAKLDGDAAKRILGGEACMWAELISPETVDSRVWPRAAAIAERLWSPRETADVDSMYVRMERVSRTLDWTGAQHRAAYGAMLDRMAGGRPSAPLRAVADACDALGLSGRRRENRTYTTQSPLNRLVDAARPESELARAMELEARAAVGSGPAVAVARARLREQFRQWAANDAAFAALAEGNALLNEVRPVSKNLSQAGEIGLKALDYIEKGQAAPQGWAEKQSAELDRFAKPAAEVTLAAVRPVKVLLDGLAHRSR